MKNLEDKEDLYSLVFSELKSLGVKVPKIKKFKLNVAKQDKSILENGNKVFGTCLSEQEWISEAGCPLPKFIAAATLYLKNYIDVEIGLFRKAGSVARQRDLRIKLENGGDFENCEPNDVASLLKQWLRELPEPVIPIYLHDLFVKCLSLDSEEDRLEAVLISCLLLPSEHLYTLKHLLKFLSDMAQKSDVNKMVPHNLAVVMAPNLLSCGCERPDKSSSGMVHCYTTLVELLIVNADKVGEVPPRLSSQVTIKLNDDFDFSLDPLDSSPSKLRRKRRSAGVSDLVNGIRKFVGNNLTPINNCLETSDEHKPASPRSARKRKAAPDLHPLSDIKKRPVNDVQPINLGQSPLFVPIEKASFMNSLTVPVNGPGLSTPLSHIRRKSFGLLGKKRRKRGKSSTKPCSVASEIMSPVISTTQLPNSFCENDNKNLQTDVPKNCQLTVPEIDLNPKMNLLSAASSSSSNSEKPAIIRAVSDQPLYPKRVNEKPKRLTSSSEEYISFKKSPLLEPIQFKNTMRSKRHLLKYNNQSPHISPALLKSELIISMISQSSTIRNGGTRTSRRKTNSITCDVVTNVSSCKSDPDSEDFLTLNTEQTTLSLSTSNPSEFASQKESLKVKQNPELSPSSNELAKVSIDSASSPHKNGSNNVNHLSDMIIKTPDIKRCEKESIKRGGNKSSLRRGRPNTVKTGLPSDLCPKYSNDSFMALKLPIDMKNGTANGKNGGKDQLQERLIPVDSILKNGQAESSITKSDSPSKVNLDISQGHIDNSDTAKLNKSANQNSICENDHVECPGNKSNSLSKFNSSVSPDHMDNSDTAKWDKSVKKDSLCKNDVSFSGNVSYDSVDCKNVPSDYKNVFGDSIECKNSSSEHNISSDSIQYTNVSGDSIECKNSSSEHNISSDSIQDKNVSFDCNDNKNCNSSDYAEESGEKENSEALHACPNNGNSTSPSKNAISKNWDGLASISISVSMASSEEGKENVDCVDGTTEAENCQPDSKGDNVGLKQETEIWNSDARTFLNENLMPLDIQSCKRESIVQLIMRNAGKVQANVQHYNHMAKGITRSRSVSESLPNSLNNTPYHRANTSVDGSTGRQTPYSKDRQHSALHQSESVNTCGKLKYPQSDSKTTSRSLKYRKSPLPPPPKFQLTDLSSMSSPLKEVTNLSSSRDSHQSKTPQSHSAISPVDHLKASPLLARRTKNDLGLTKAVPPKRRMIKSEVESTSKFTKAYRSESSPASTKISCRRSERLKESESRSPSPKIVKSHKGHSQSFSSAHNLEANRA